MRTKLLNCLPSIRWVPFDIPSTAPTDSPSNNATSTPSQNRRVTFTRKHTSSTTKRQQREAARFPLHTRKSTLSLNSEADDSLFANTSPQSQSPFFSKLPLEVRRMVYEYIVGPPEVVHLTLGVKRRYAHFICGAGRIGVGDSLSGEDGEEGQGMAWDERVGDEGEGKVGFDCGCRVLVGGRESRRLEQSQLAMVRFCRRMYSEAISSLYKPHTFSLLHITHLLYLPSRLPQPRLNNIRTLRLRWAIRALPFLRRPANLSRYAYQEDTENWLRVWKMLSEMTGLRELFVVISDANPQGLWRTGWCELEGKLLEPVKQVTRPRWFVLCLPYEECRADWDMGDCKVELRKPGGDVIDEEP